MIKCTVCGGETYPDPFVAGKRLCWTCIVDKRLKEIGIDPEKLTDDQKREECLKLLRAKL